MNRNPIYYLVNLLATKAQVFSMLLLLMATAMVASAADTYVTFKDGHLYVFPESCVQSVTQTDEYLMINALDGTVFSYSLEDVELIEDQLTKQLPELTSYKFNNKFNYQVITDATGVITGDTVNVEVAGIGKRLTASFSLSDDNARALVDGVVQESKVSRLRFDTSKVYTVGYDGDMVLSRLESGEYALVPFGRNYLVNVDFLTDHNPVPRIYINTVDSVKITSKYVYVDAEIIIDGAGVFPSMTDSVQIKGRGNSSWSTNPDSKNPYRLKFKSKVKPLGLTKAKSWVLLSNRQSGSMMTNAIGMKAASLIGTVAPCHMIPVDLYLNGTYKGSYNFAEKVGLANNSVDIDDETAAVMLEMDRYYNDPATQKFRSTPYNLPVNIKHPDFGEDETVLTLAMIKEKFNEFLTVVEAEGDIDHYVDLDAAARYLMLNELIMNAEIFQPKSTFCYNENILADSCKYVFGPAWDFDWAFAFNGTHAATYFLNRTNYDFYLVNASKPNYPLMRSMYDFPGVKEHIYEMWEDFKGDKLDELCEFVQDYYNYASESFLLNKEAGLDPFDYSKQVAKAQNWLRQRFEYVHEYCRIELLPVGDVNGDGFVTISDATALISYLLGGGEVEPFYESKADVDADGNLNISDAIMLINKLLNEGAAN